MQTVIGVFVSVVLLIVVTWIAIFGGIGALLSRARDHSLSTGFAWGAGLGPVGWLVILWVTRERRVTDDVQQTVSVEPSGIATGSSSAPEQWDPWNR
jgi:hypothetical protein